MSHAETVVRFMLSEAWLPANEDEIEALVRAYAELKPNIESLYLVTEARHESPALIFNPDPIFTDWG